MRGLTVEQLDRIRKLLIQTRDAVLTETTQPDNELLNEEIERRMERVRLDIQPESPPQNERNGDVWADVINEEMSPTALLYCIARRQQGIDKYGVPLAADNGRASWRDMLQEVLDGQAYAEQEIQQLRAMYAKLPDIPVEKMAIARAIDAIDIDMMISICQNVKNNLRKALEESVLFAHVRHRYNERKNRD